MLGVRRPPATPAEETKDLKLKILKRDLKVVVIYQPLVLSTFSTFQVETSKRLQEKVDRAALLLFPFIFLVFNLIYWPFYLLYIQNKI